MQAITSHMNLQLCMLQSLYDKATQQEKIGRIKEREGHVCSKFDKVFLDGSSLRTHLEVHEAHIKKIMIWREHNLQRIEQRKRRHLQDDFEGGFLSLLEEFYETFPNPTEHLVKKRRPVLRTEVPSALHHVPTKKWADIECPEQLDVDDAEVDGAEEATSNQEGVIIPLSLGPRESGHIRVLGLTANKTLETLRDEVGRALGLRRHMVVLIDASTRTEPPLDRKMSEFSPPGSIGATIRIPAGDPEGKGVPIQIFGAHSSGIPILLPPHVEPQYLPTFLCEELGIDMEMSIAWSAQHTQELGTMWCYLPTQALIANSGWSKAQVQTQLIRGGIESNPGPGKKRGRPPGKKISQSGTLDLASIPVGTVSYGVTRPRSDRTPPDTEISLADTEQGRETILEKRARGILQTNRNSVNPPKKGEDDIVTADFPSRHLFDIGSLRKKYNTIIRRPSFRKLYHQQLPCWKELCSGICRNFLEQNEDIRQKISWNLMCTVK